MTIKTFRTEIEGRTYKVDYDHARCNEPASFSIQIYRIRKDGTRGFQLSTTHRWGWQAWAQVRDKALAAA